MRKIILTLTAFFAGLQAFSQNDLSIKLSAVRPLIENGHIEPRKFDDSLSSHLFDAFLASIDPSFDFFLQSDVKALEKYRYALDDEMNSRQYNFFNEALQRYKTRLNKASGIIATTCSKPFDFNIAEFYDYGTDTNWSATEEQWQKKWYLQLKADVLRSLAGIASNQLALKNTVNKAEVLGKEAEMRKKTRDRYQKNISEILQNDTEIYRTVSNHYLNALLLCMDPHSDFMDASQKADFQSQLESEGLFFGFSLGDTDKGEVEVTSIQPGGPAWSSGAIHKDDVLLKLKWASKEPVDLAGLDAEEVSALLDESKTEKVDLTIRKKSGEIQMVVLQKRKLENDENIVKSFVLRGSKNIGYITLPSFYTQWGDAAGSSCANDVAKEIIKLKKDSISGLILDLRYNGGGSLQEAIEMAGIFIDEGGLCQLKMKESNAKEPKMVTLKDVNRGLIYNGPMILLVNGYSASASELLAGSLQDYNRALIVGTRTYGKATGQEIKPAGDAFVKLTNLKLYRITGKTAQFQGVQPDVKLPEPYEHIAEFESDNDFAIRPDTVGAYKYFKPLKPLSKNNLQQQSMTRVKNPKFDALHAYAKKMEERMQPRKVSLKWETVEQQLKNDKASFSQDILHTPTSLFRSNNNKADQKFIDNDAAARDINTRWLERIAQDPFIEETYQIMLDFIQLNK